MAAAGLRSELGSWEAGVVLAQKVAEQDVARSIQMLSSLKSELESIPLRWDCPSGAEASCVFMVQCPLLATRDSQFTLHGSWLCWVVLVLCLDSWALRFQFPLSRFLLSSPLLRSLSLSLSSDPFPFSPLSSSLSCPFSQSSLCVSSVLSFLSFPILFSPRLSSSLSFSRRNMCVCTKKTQLIERHGLKGYLCRCEEEERREQIEQIMKVDGEARLRCRVTLQCPQFLMVTPFGCDGQDCDTQIEKYKMKVVNFGRGVAKSYCQDDPTESLPRSRGLHGSCNYRACLQEFKFVSRSVENNLWASVVCQRTWPSRFVQCVNRKLTMFLTEVTQPLTDSKPVHYVSWAELTMITHGKVGISMQFFFQQWHEQGDDYRVQSDRWLAIQNRVPCVEMSTWGSYAPM